MLKLFLVLVVTLTIAQSVFAADYGYHVNKNGTSYVRDDSNNGNPYDNANYLGLNR